MPFFGGPVAEAVAESRAGFKPLVVVLAGQNAEGDAVARAVLAQAGEEHLASCILLRLEDDLGNADPAHFRDAKNFRAFCPVAELPAVVMVSPAGAALATLSGQQVADAEALRLALTAAFTQVKQQQAAFLAAQAFAALAQHAAAGAPAPGVAAAGAQQGQQVQQGQQAHHVPAAPPQEQMGAAAGTPDSADTLMQQGGDTLIQQGAEEQGNDRSAAPPAVSQPHPAPTLPDAEMAGGVEENGAVSFEEVPVASQGSGREGSNILAVAAAAARAGDAEMAEAAGEGKAAGEGGKAEKENAETAAGEMAEAMEEGGSAAEQEQEQPITFQLRFTDGSTLRLEFSSSDTLSTVFAAIDKHRATAASARAVPAAPAALSPYVLVLPQPQAPRQFGASEEGSTLGALGLGPRTSLAVVPNLRGHKPPPPPPPPPSLAQQQQQQQQQQQGVAAGEQQQAVADVGREGEQPAADTVDTADTAEAAVGEGSLEGETQETVDSAAVAGESLNTETQQAQQQQQQQQEQQVLKLHVRLPHGPPLVHDFPPGSTLAAVFAAVDAHMDAGAAAAASGGKKAPAPGPYVLAAPHLGRQFGPGEAGSSLEELGIEPRTSLTAQPSAAGHRPVRGPAAAAAGSKVARGETPAAGAGAAGPADRPPQQQQQQQQQPVVAAGPSQLAVQQGQQAKQAQQQAPETAVPAVITLQFKQPDGGTLRGDFAPDSTLQQIFHYIDTHRTDGGGAYALVQPYPRRQFGLGGAPGGSSGSGGGGGGEMGRSLLQLGLGQRSLLIMEAVGGAAHTGAGSSWSVGGLLSYLNPLAYMRPQQSMPSSAQQSGPSTAQQAAGPPEESLEPGEAGGGAGAGRSGTRKRALGQIGGGNSNIHTLGREEEAGGQAGGRGGGGANSYWNGNSTAFGGDGPEDKGSK